jgi:L,D-peptidoglycan transpeptidase YkuD (ErfK/YbiS/YcfS/YnhG family)
MPRPVAPLVLAVPAVLAVLAVLAGLIGLAGPVAGPARAASTDATSVVRLGGVRVHLQPGTSQVVTTNRTSGPSARVTFWELDHGRWSRPATTRDGRIGYGGLSRPARRHQGDGTTPAGTFRLTSAFGTHARRRGWRMPYHRLRSGDYWVGDNGSRYYNRLRNRAAGGFRWWLPASDDNGSERLLAARSQYEYAFATSFNAGQVRHRGFAIFLHVNGRGATAGCVSAPRPFLQRLYRRLDPRRSPVIAIGR